MLSRNHLFALYFFSFSAKSVLKMLYKKKSSKSQFCYIKSLNDLSTKIYFCLLQ